MKSKFFSMFLKNFLKSFDYFSVTFDFRIDKKERYGSITGGICFLLYIIFALIFFLKSLLDYISFKEAKITYLDKSTEPSPPLNFKNLNFSYAVQVTFENDTSIRNSSFFDLFNVYQKFNFYNKTQDSKLSIISNWRNCKVEDFKNLSQEFPKFKRQNISDFDCFDFYDNFTLQGIYTDDYMSYAEIVLEINPKFLELDSKSNFYNYDNLQKIFKDNFFKFTLYYIDSYNDITDKNKPVFYKLDATYMYLDLYYFRRNNVYFQQLSYEEDKNLFYINYESNSFMKSYTLQLIDLPINDRINSRLKEKSFLSKYIIRSINNQKIIKISYVKIPEFLASLSGLLMNTLIILNIFLFYFNNIEAKQKIINKIMKYKDIIKSSNLDTLNYLSNKFDDDNFKNRISIKANKAQTILNNSKMNNFENLPISVIEKDLIKCNTTDFKLYNFNSNIKKTNQCIIEKIEHNLCLNSNDSMSNNEDSMKESLIVFPFEKLERTNIQMNSSLPHDSRCNDTNNKKQKANFNKKNSLNKNSVLKKNPYAIYAFDILCKLLCCCSTFLNNKKLKLFENAEKKFNHNIDMVTYMKKMQELDIIKYLLLDENTLELVNFISKPCVSMSTKKIEDSEYKLFFETIEEVNFVSYQNIDSVKKCYDSILEKSERSHIEERIIKLFEMQIEEIIL